MSDALLILNAGSSSLKFRLFGLTAALPMIAGGQVSHIGDRMALQSVNPSDEPEFLPNGADAATSLQYALDWVLARAGGWALRACGHRIVHGGPNYVHATEMDRQTVDDLRQFSCLAPQHQDHDLAAIETLWTKAPRLRQFGCFDTAFHAGLTPLHQAFALPHGLREQGIRRYGFHGLSYAWIAHELQRHYPDLARGRVVAAHLGNGASLCALKAGKSVDTTMGMTALDGLPMGTRCGALDPGAVLHMQTALGLGPHTVQTILYTESGLKGLSGVSHDVRVLLESPEPAAAFAIEFFTLKTAQQIAAMMVSLGGLDGLIFTGGIGENAAPIRNKILHHLSSLPQFETHIIAANEERQMALEIFAAFYQESVS